MDIVFFAIFSQLKRELMILGPIVNAFSIKSGSMHLSIQPTALETLEISKRKPFFPFLTTSLTPPTSEATTGIPQDKASKTVEGNPSVRDGSTKTRVF